MVTQNKLVTYDDYQNLPDDGKRYEISGGKLYIAPSPNTLHQRISRKLEYELEDYIRKHNSGEIFTAPMDVVLSMTDVVQPDLMYISKERSRIITEKNIVAAPDLVIAITSESTKTIDQTSKKTLYEKHGVREYWIVDPENKQAEQYVLREASFKLNDELKTSDKLISEVINGFSLPLNKIFEE